MYHKLKNTLMSLGLVAALFAGGFLFAEPLAPVSPQAAPAPQARELARALALVQVAVALAQANFEATQAGPAPVQGPTWGHRDGRAPSRPRLELGMPFYSFGTVLPRRRES